MSVRSLAALAAALFTLSAVAEEAPASGPGQVSLAVQRDSQRNQQAAAALRLPVSRNTWVTAGAGSSRSPDAATGRTMRPKQLSAGVGVAGSAWQATLEATRRRDGSTIKQTDWAAAADMRPVDGVSVGVDATRRTARLRSGTTEQRLRGRGVGVHGAVAVGQQLTLHGAAMRNRYKVSEATTQAAAPGVLGLLQPRPSAINREELALARSAQFGATWRFANQTTLTGEVLNDRLQQGGSLRTLQLKAAIPVGAGWTLAPAVGRSRGPDGQSSTYGQLGGSYAW